MSDKAPAASPSVRNIYQRMVEVQKKVLTVMKNEKIEMKGERGYKGVTHDDVAALLHLPLAEAGIVLLPDITDFKVTEFELEKTGYNGKYIQKWYRTDMKILVKWINADDPNDFIQSTGGSFALDTSDKGFAKAYSLALKIVLLKVHLLESRDGEEQRLFENEQNQPAKGQSKGPLPPATPKNPPASQKSQQRKPPSNRAPASEDMLETIHGYCIDRDVNEGVINSLITKGYGMTTGKIPIWVAEEIIDLMSNPDTNAATVMAEALRVERRRQEAQAKNSNPTGGES